MLTLIFASALAATGPTVPPAPDVASVVAAERAFAADSPTLGVAGSFNKWSTPDAIIIGDGRVSRVRDAYPDGPRPADEPLLEWWPNFAGIARSGDLGFTTGGVQVGGQRTGHYFTVWLRQSDGSWKWVYDGGSGASAADVPGRDVEPVRLPIAPPAPAAASAPGAPSASARAMAEVREAEAALALAAASDQSAAYRRVLADNGRLYVAPRPPAIGRDAFAAALADWPAVFEFGPTEGGGASEAGDLVWTYGPARWTRPAGARQGHYVRMWQRQSDGWRIVLAQLIPAPIAAPPPAGG